ncbi:unnamed protein product [Caenorhabditis auriculariae]|uniref:AAA+ ATPase domain-containing protein n=1 Tax=Caenorhabditis auriculariae TaxID=2777116 RepID=A0A8S1HN96_9PELO|nr:unnamed protein product [Caenorhabditis auriculariae]
MEYWESDFVFNVTHRSNEYIAKAAKGGSGTREEIEQIYEALMSLVANAPNLDCEVNKRRILGIQMSCQLLRASLGSEELSDSANFVRTISSTTAVLTPENSSTCSVEMNQSSRDELDTFAESRRKAIESTLVTDCSNLPSFSDIAGLGEAKNALIEALVDPILYPEWFENTDLQPWKALLLFGPPGTGKSALAQATVRQLDAVLYQVSSSDLISSWSGQSEKLIRELFEQAASSERTVVVFIDEVDSLCRERCSEEGDANRRVKTELLVQMQKLQHSKQVILLCATNCPWDLDPAFLRRFEKKIYISLPETEARVEILQKRLEKTSLDTFVTFEWLASMTEGFSGDDIRRLCSELAYLQFRFFKQKRQFDASFDKKKPLDREDVCSVLLNFVKTVDEKQLSRFEQYLRQ